MDPTPWIAKLVEKHPHVLGWAILAFIFRWFLEMVLVAVANGYIKRGRPVPQGLDTAIDVVRILPVPGKSGPLGLPFGVPGVTSSEVKAESGIGSTLKLLPLVFLVGLAGCGGMSADWKVNNPTTLGDCLEAAPGVAVGLQEGIASKGSFSSIMGLIGAFAPCAKAVAIDLLTSPKVPSEVKGRAELVLSLAHSVILRKYTNQLQLNDVPASGERMQNSGGEMMIRGFGR